jgi:hypothetical protein
MKVNSAWNICFHGHNVHTGQANSRQFLYQCTEQTAFDYIQGNCIFYCLSLICNGMRLSFCEKCEFCERFKKLIFSLKLLVAFFQVCYFLPSSSFSVEV